MKGYKEKPFIIEFISLIYLLNPIGNIIFLVFLNQSGSPMQNFMNLLTDIFVNVNLLRIINVVFWISAIPLAIGLYRVQLWAWYYFLIHAVGMFILSWIGPDFTFAPSYASLINFVFLIPIGYFVSHEIKTPYFNPNLKWWEQAKRYKHTVDIVIDNKSYETFDISVDGAFIIDTDKQNDFEIEEYVPIIIELDDERIECFAEVRWVNNDSTTYPIGYGIKFEKISGKDRARIKNFTSNLTHLGAGESRA